MWLLEKLLRKVIRQGRLTIIDHDGRTYDFGSGSEPPVVLRFTRPGTAGRIVRNPQLGAGEAYMDGELLVQPPHDILRAPLLCHPTPARAQALAQVVVFEQRDELFAHFDGVLLRRKQGVVVRLIEREVRRDGREDARDA